VFISVSRLRKCTSRDSRELLIASVFQELSSEWKQVEAFEWGGVVKYN
jgi:hypothetical protein